MPGIEIKNLHHEKRTHPWDIKVDRYTPLGNPFKMAKYTVSERDHVCDEYVRWFYDHLNDSKVREYLEMILRIYEEHGKLRLFCWCAPQRCHAETIANYIERQRGVRFHDKIQDR